MVVVVLAVVVTCPDVVLPVFVCFVLDDCELLRPSSVLESLLVELAVDTMLESSLSEESDDLPVLGIVIFASSKSGAVNAARGPTRKLSRLELSNQTMGSHFFVLINMPENSPISPVNLQKGYPTFVASPNLRQAKPPSLSGVPSAQRL